MDHAGNLAGIEEEINCLEAEKAQIDKDISALKRAAEILSKRKHKSSIIQNVNTEKTALENIVAVLKDSGREMTNIEIFNELIKRGVNIEKGTSDAHLSRESKNPKTPIQKIGYGKYRYFEGVKTQEAIDEIVKENMVNNPVTLAY